MNNRLNHTLSVTPAGLRCLTIPVPASRSLTLLVLVRAGSRYESRDDNGISHFMEHMFFKGAERYPDTMAVAGAIDGAGGSFNAFTGEELVGYYVKISSARKNVAYDVLSDMLLNAKFDSAEIGRERGVIVEEIRMHHDDPMSQVYLDFHRLVFGDQPLGWDIAGPEENVLSMQRENFLAHHQKHYHAGNCVVVCAGDITTDEHEELCRKYFVFPDEKKESEPVPYIKPDTPRLHVRNKETEQAHFVFGFRSSPAEYEDIPPLKLLNNILGGSMSSRLFYEIRERRGLAYYIHSSLSAYLDTGLFTVSAGVNLKKVRDAFSCALDEIGKIKTEAVKDEELERAKQNIIGQTDLALEDSRRVANLYGGREILYRKIRTPEELAAEVENVTREQIKYVAEKYLVNESLKFCLIGPYGDKLEWENDIRLA